MLIGKGAMSTREHLPPTAGVGKPLFPRRRFVYVCLFISLWLPVFVAALNVELSEETDAGIEVKVVQEFEEENQQTEYVKNNGSTEWPIKANVDRCNVNDLRGSVKVQDTVQESFVATVMPKYSTTNGEEVENFVVTYKRDASKKFPYNQFPYMLDQLEKKINDGADVTSALKDKFKHFMAARKIKMEPFHDVDMARQTLLGFHTYKGKLTKENATKWVIQSKRKVDGKQESALYQGLNDLKEYPATFVCSIESYNYWIDDATIHFKDEEGANIISIPYRANSIIDFTIYHKHSMMFKVNTKQWEEIKIKSGSELVIDVSYKNVHKKNKVTMDKKVSRDKVEERRMMALQWNRETSDDSSKAN
eukprot:GHVS01015240.1.p1 GENE.GHVS01015240.1~~GHVS01015240.1.p1  ORF type:complete len:363 (-),score=47.59 GHVS01015240.1:292-1380(-)